MSTSCKRSAVRRRRATPSRCSAHSRHQKSQPTSSLRISSRTRRSGAERLIPDQGQGPRIVVCRFMKADSVAPIRRNSYELRFRYDGLTNCRHRFRRRRRACRRGRETVVALDQHVRRTRVAGQRLSWDVAVEASSRPAGCCRCSSRWRSGNASVRASLCGGVGTPLRAFIG
jgi:hypothetical protein